MTGNDYPSEVVTRSLLLTNRAHAAAVVPEFRGGREIGMGYFQTRAILSREPLGSDTAFATSSFSYNTVKTRHEST